MHCGPIHGTLLYYTDQMTQGGANIIIEVTRQGKCTTLNCHIFFIASSDLSLCTAILDLQKMLANRNTPLDMPEHLILQFDNCSENKVRYILQIIYSSASLFLITYYYLQLLLSEQIHVRLHFIARSREIFQES